MKKTKLTKYFNEKKILYVRRVMPLRRRKKGKKNEGIRWWLHNKVKNQPEGGGGRADGPSGARYSSVCKEPGNNIPAGNF